MTRAGMDKPPSPPFDPRGFRPGRLPFGYQRSGDSVVACNRHWIAARWLAVQLMGNELNCSRTVAELPEDFPWKPVPRNLKRWFLNPLLRGGIGHGVLKGITSNVPLYAHVEWGRAPVLINPEEWETVSSLLLRKGGGWPTTPRLLSGLIRCEGCGKNLRWHTPKRTNSKGKEPPARYACSETGCRFCGRGLREDRVRAAIVERLQMRARPRMVGLARQGGLISGGHLRRVESPELLKLRAQLKLLDELVEQGVPKLGPARCRVQMQMLPLQAWCGDELWLDECYGALLRDRRTLGQASDDLLRPVFLRFVIEVLYQGAPDQFIVRLR
jgi:hypothetical protein